MYFNIQFIFTVWMESESAQAEHHLVRLRAEIPPEQWVRVNSDGDVFSADTRSDLGDVTECAVKAPDRYGGSAPPHETLVPGQPLLSLLSLLSPALRLKVCEVVSLHSNISPQQLVHAICEHRMAKVRASLQVASTVSNTNINTNILKLLGITETNRLAWIASFLDREGSFGKSIRNYMEPYLLCAWRDAWMDACETSEHAPREYCLKEHPQLPEAMVLFGPVPEGCMRLYHGTTANVDLTHWTSLYEPGDFGRALYTTDNLAYAMEIAHAVSILCDDMKYAVIAFDVPVQALQVCVPDLREHNEVVWREVVSASRRTELHKYLKTNLVLRDLMMKADVIDGRISANDISAISTTDISATDISATRALDIHQYAFPVNGRDGSNFLQTTIYKVLWFGESVTTV